MTLLANVTLSPVEEAGHQLQTVSESGSKSRQVYVKHPKAPQQGIDDYKRLQHITIEGCKGIMEGMQLS